MHKKESCFSDISPEQCTRSGFPQWFVPVNCRLVTEPLETFQSVYEHILRISNLSCSQHLHYLVPRPPPCSLAVHVELWDGLMSISLVSLSHDAPHSLISELYWSLETRQAFFVMLFLIIMPLSAECMKWHQLPL